MTVDVLVIGVGNRMRSDDAVGLVVADEITQSPALAGISVAYVEGECYSLLELWNEVPYVTVIDAARGPAPGVIHRFDAIEESVPVDLLGTSSHGFGVLHAVELARILGRLPDQLIVYGVAGSDFSVGLGLSPETSGAVPRLIKSIQRELTSFNEDASLNTV